MENQEQDLRAAITNGSGLKAQLERIPNASAADAPAEEAAPAAVDAWLERRLRVFERALGQLEARQEKAERDLIRRIALLEEKLAAYEKSETVALPMPSSVATPDPEIARAPVAMMPASVPLSEPAAEEIILPEKPLGDFLSHARRAANSATPALPHPPKAKGTPRWMAWAAVGCACAMTMTALALGTVAGASETAGAGGPNQNPPGVGRRVAPGGSGGPA